MTEFFLDALDRNVRPDAVAVSDATESVTYGELIQQAQEIAGLLAQRHEQSGFVVVKAAPRVRFITTLLGAMYWGGTPVPIDPDLPAPALDYIRERSQAIDVLDPTRAR